MGFMKEVIGYFTGVFMRYFGLGLCGLALLASAPAMAGELRAEARGGVSWTGGLSAKAVYGAAVGYDTDISLLGTGVFAGVEQSADKAPTGGDVRWGTSVRAGIKVLMLGSLYATGGYHYGSGAKATSLGAGYQKGIGPVYGKIEYRHYFPETGGAKADGLLLGVGLRF